MAMAQAYRFFCCQKCRNPQSYPLPFKGSLTSLPATYSHAETRRVFLFSRGGAETRRKPTSRGDAEVLSHAKTQRRTTLLQKPHSYPLPFKESLTSLPAAYSHAKARRREDAKKNDFFTKCHDPIPPLQRASLTLPFFRRGGSGRGWGSCVHYDFASRKHTQRMTPLMIERTKPNHRVLRLFRPWFFFASSREIKPPRLRVSA
jgi:hypothetical protein